MPRCLAERPNIRRGYRPLFPNPETPLLPQPGKDNQLRGERRGTSGVGEGVKARFHERTKLNEIGRRRRGIRRPQMNGNRRHCGGR